MAAHGSAFATQQGHARIDIFRKELESLTVGENFGILVLIADVWSLVTAFSDLF